MDFLIHGPDIPNTINPKESFTQVLVRKLLEYPREEIAAIQALSKESITYHEILQNAVEIANQFQALGAQNGDILVIMAENHIHYHQYMLAAFLIDVIVAPLNPIHTSYELDHMFTLLQPKFVVSGQEAQQTINQLQDKFNYQIIKFARIVTRSNDEVFHEKFLQNILQQKVDSLNKPLVILSSSGTTGLPKGIVHTHASLKAMLHSLKSMNSGPGDVTMGLLPFFHSIGVNSIFANLYWQQKMIVVKKFAPQTFFSTIEMFQISKLWIVPTIALFLAQTNLIRDYNLSSLKEIICSGAAVSHNILNDIKNRLKVDLRNAYGMSEFAFGVVMPAGNQNNTLTKIGSCGKFLSGFTAKVIDVNHYRALPAHQTGELCVKSSCAFVNYFQNIEETRKTIDCDGFIHTGDIAYYDDDGFIYIVDRLKEMIKCKGYQVSPVELELLLLKHECVKDAAVIGVPDERCGEKPRAFVVLKEKHEDENQIVEELIKFVATHMSPYKHLIGGVCVVREIPKNPSGKILRRKLKEIYIN